MDDCIESAAYSVNDYADLLITRFETAHETVQELLGVAASRITTGMTRGSTLKAMNLMTNCLS